MSNGKKRLDNYLVEQGIFSSREKAKRNVMAGYVFIDGRRVHKPSYKVGPNHHVEVRGRQHPYVSRGGMKLAKALQVFGVDVRGKTCADLGASTGGFTDCLLQHGAAKVFAIDVGYGQLDWKLRRDERVVVFERFNARYLETVHLGMQVDFVCIDVAFISVLKMIMAIKNILKAGGDLVVLIKPQFEAGPESVHKGVVRDDRIQAQVIEQVVSGMARAGLSPVDLSYSPITGPAGNIEFLLYCVNEDRRFEPDVWRKTVIRVVGEAVSSLSK